jgi:hypothetical protein
MADYLAFQTIVDKAEYPTAVFKFNGKDTYCWHWLYNGPCYMSYVDFTTGEAGHFGQYEESHQSYHNSGQQHSSVVDKQRKLRMTVRQEIPVDQIQSWQPAGTAPVQLGSPLPWKMNIPEWQRAKQVITLDSNDYEGYSRIDLCSYLCRQKFIAQLLAGRSKFGKSWILGDGELRLVIIASD